MTQTHDSDGDGHHNTASGTNPYQPPADANCNHFAHRRSVIPGGTFWAIAITTFVFAMFITYLTQGITSPVVIALPFGIVRVCLIHWRRSCLGLDELDTLPLLFTSTLVASGLGLACAIAFGGICTGGLVIVGNTFQGSPYGVLLTMTFAFAVAGCIAFLILLVWSIKWAS